jgi:predicted negative regulator of RcsB-dependent stress response
MATNLDLQEQEQLDQLKHFWNQYGNLITWVLIAVLGAYAAWNGWQWWQRDQAVKAGALYDEVEKAVQGGEVDRAATLFATLRERYGRTSFGEQGGLLLAKAQYEKGQADNAVVTLRWVVEQASEDEYRTIARLRLASILLDRKQYDEALKALEGATAKEFEALVADRRGDVLIAQGKKAEAKAAYQKAWSLMGSEVGYRRVVDAKLTALGAAPSTDRPATAEAQR